MPHPPRRRYALRLPGGATLALGERTLVMGILNVTPDSFSDGGRYADPARAVDAALAMVEAGADLIDIGGESTRPGAPGVDADEERRRVEPVIAALVRQTRVPLSIDTKKSRVAEAALGAGAVIVNDISGLRADAELASVTARAGAGLVVMHMRGETREMYRQAVYADVAAEVVDELGWSVRTAVDAGVPRDAIVVDPGIGFAKKAEHSWELLGRLDALDALELPILVGASRKSFLQQAIGERPPRERDTASHAAATVSVLAGAHIVRVHDVEGCVQAVRVADMIIAAEPAQS